MKLVTAAAVAGIALSPLQMDAFATLGILIAATTSKETRLAVVAAGATPYFSMRPSEDMLGKNDAVIAKHAPVGVFSPGHDKWDYRYTLGERIVSSLPKNSYGKVLKKALRELEQSRDD